MSENYRQLWFFQTKNDTYHAVEYQTSDLSLAKQSCEADYGEQVKSVARLWVNRREYYALIFVANHGDEAANSVRKAFMVDARERSRELTQQHGRNHETNQH